MWPPGLNLHFSVILADVVATCLSFGQRNARAIYVLTCWILSKIQNETLLTLYPLLLHWMLELTVGRGWVFSVCPLDALSTIQLFCALGNWLLWTPRCPEFQWG